MYFYLGRFYILNLLTCTQLPRCLRVACFSFPLPSCKIVFLFFTFLKAHNQRHMRHHILETSLLSTCCHGVLIPEFILLLHKPLSALGLLFLHFFSKLLKLNHMQAS